MEEKYLVTATPHIRDKSTTRNIMLDVIIALMPAAVVAVVFYGIRAVMIIGLAIASCVLSELAFQKAMKRKVSINDLSAVVTGLLLAYNMPASSPWWMPIVGGVFAIVIVKQLFGGIGQNFMNPALCARAFLLSAYPNEMTNWSAVPFGADAISSATPLALLKDGYTPVLSDITNALLGLKGGCLGEVCSIALIIGGIYLIARKVISWRTPVSYIVTVFLLSWIFGRNGMFTGNPFYEIFVGGLMLGAFFMATDYSTSPVTPMGKIVMGIGCGVLTVIIRKWGGYPEGVSYSILLMNVAAPLIERFTKPRLYGEVRKDA